MIQSLRRNLSIASAIAAMVPKLYLAYSIWVWVEFFTQILTMVIYVYFWRAVYTHSATIAGLSLDQTLNYMLLMPMLAPMVETRVLLDLGYLVREGRIGIELLRPWDLQGRYYVENVVSLAINLLLRIPLLVIAWVFFGLRLPGDPLTWGAFLLTLFLGQAAIFFLDWMVACLAFYTTEVWGLGILRVGVATFFSGALLPLDMMPAWLQRIAAAMPFAQAVYAPAALLSGITPLAEAPRLWLVQLAWIAGLGLLSRGVFNLAVRKVTVQGG